MQTQKWKADSGKAFDEAGKILKEGGIIAFPTDTVYGLGAIYKNTDAVKKIFLAKGRDEGKPLSILISDISQVPELVESVPEEAGILMEKFWPGALTIIFRKSELVPECVSAGGDTVGIRMPADPAAVNLIAAAGSPLAAPSANLSGKRSSVSFEDVMEDLDGRIDGAIDGGSCPVGISSTVLDLSGESFRILREGTVTAEMIQQELCQ